MSTPVRLAAFAVLLVLLGLAGAALGAAVGPIGPGAGSPGHGAMTESAPLQGPWRDSAVRTTTVQELR